MRRGLKKTLDDKKTKRHSIFDGKNRYFEKKVTKNRQYLTENQNKLDIWQKNIDIARKKNNQKRSIFDSKPKDARYLTERNR